MGYYTSNKDLYYNKVKFRKIKEMLSSKLLWEGLFLGVIVFILTFIATTYFLLETMPVNQPPQTIYLRSK